MADITSNSSSVSSNSGTSAASEWLIEGRRLVPLLPRLVPQTAFTQTATQAAKEVAEKNAQLMNPALTGNKECMCLFLQILLKLQIRNACS